MAASKSRYGVRLRLFALLVIAASTTTAAFAESECDREKDPERQLALGLKYAAGDGVGQSDWEARACVKAAAEAGLPRAQLQLAIYLMQGKGGQGNGLEELYWLDRAASSGLELAIKMRDDLGGGLDSMGVLRRVSDKPPTFKGFPFLLMSACLLLWGWLAFGNRSPWPWRWNGKRFQDQSDLSA